MNHTSPPAYKAERYHLQGLLGHGATGEVHAARDLVRQETVALKLFFPDYQPEPLLARREVAALLALDLPGVVSMLDEGELEWQGERRRFLSMSLVEGLPFPSAQTAWDELRPLLLRLLVVLRGVHKTGIVHRDLKPEHVRIQADGSPVLLDLGTACGPAAGRADARRMRIGSIDYMAPEQFVDAERADQTTDLYAFGLMLLGALTGRSPGQVLPRTQRLRGVIPDDPTWPEAARALLPRLLAREPTARFPSAESVLQTLGEGSRAEVAALFGHRQVPMSSTEMRGLFAGPDCLFHLQEDAAEILWARTRGDVSAISGTLARWLDAGVVHRQNDTLVVTRAALDGLRIGMLDEVDDAMRLDVGHPLRMAQLAAQGEYERIVVEARQHCERCWQRGDISAALAGLSRLVRLADALADTAGMESLLLRLSQLALASGAVRDLQSARYMLSHSGTTSPLLGQVAALLGALEAVRSGESTRSRTLLEQIEPFEDEDLDRWRMVVTVEEAQHRGAQATQQALLATRAWASQRGTGTAEADLRNWTGLAAYRRGDMASAVEHCRAAALLKQHVTGKLSALGNAGAAALECGAFAETRRLAGQMLELAQPCRLTFYEGRAAWMRRTADYREGRPLQPDWPFIEASRLLASHYLQGQILITEAAIAWRGGLSAAAAELASSAAGCWSMTPHRPVALLAESLAAACVSPLDADRVEALVREACSLEKAPGLCLQALGILLWADPSHRAWCAPALERLTQSLPDILRGGVRELMSVEEVQGGVHTPPPRANGG